MREVDDEMLEKVDQYREAVRENVNNDQVEPILNQVHLQVMPDTFRTGFLHKIKGSKLGLTETWPRYGTVLNVGPEVTGLEPGEDVFFLHKRGHRFGGMYNPVQQSGDADWEDEFRVIYDVDIIGTIEYNLSGETVTYTDNLGNSGEVKVLDESVIYQGLVLIENSDGEKGWIDRKWINE